MKLVTFQASTQFGPVRRLGVIEAEGILDLEVAYLSKLVDQGVDPREAQRAAASSLPPEMERFIWAGKPALEAANEAVEFVRARDSVGLRGPAGQVVAYEMRSVRLMSPLGSPNSLRDFIAFEDHARAGAGRRGEELSPTWYERPIYYKGNHRSLVGAEDDVPRPGFTKELDFELEVACIVGGRGRDLDEQAAAEAIFGFTILNDWSARDMQRVEMAARLGPAKSKDFATSLGPCIVTADEVGASPSLAMTARLNGREICTANLGDAHWTFPRMISFVSQDEDVWPTDIYGSGTPYGGCLLDHGGPYLEPGDVVELEVETIGTLRNRVT
jgi:2-keto-4-pentenoate hydratase/2-oxohepta-3-ene-1,7-dioic acid hydratase in catechol pathway